MNNWLKRPLALLLPLVLAASVLPTGAAEAPAQELNADVDLFTEKSVSYFTYLEEYKQAASPDGEIVIEAAQGYRATEQTAVDEGVGGEAGSSLRTGETGAVEWDFTVTQPGLYGMWIEYYPIEGKGSSIVRSVHLDGELPFEEARNISLSRVWTDKEVNGTSKRSDKKGNDIKPVQEQAPRWLTAPVRDSVGYVRENLRFYLSAGTHTLRLTALREPLVIRRIRFANEDAAPSYAEVSKLYEDKGYASPDAPITTIEAEDTLAKSDASIVPLGDRSSPSVSPSHPSKIRLNYIGADKWNQNGQWIEWALQVEKSGLYKLGFKAKQDTANGANSNRRVTIDGLLPFRELETVSFRYNTHWDLVELGGADGAYAFYFEAGRTYTLRMEVVLGEEGKAIQSVEEATGAINTVYRDILIVTGTNPDVNRDYRFEETMPEVLTAMKTQREKLQEAKESLVRSTGMSGEYVQAVERMIRQLDGMMKKPASIARRFNQFQNDITALATWVNGAKNQPLSLDTIVIAPIDKTIPKTASGFFASVAYHVTSFFSSFFEDYNGVASEESVSAVTVWVGNGNTGGRDQAQVLKAMADNEFTAKNGITVNLQLVSMGALLPATLSGKGPDVALTMAQGDPVNYAVRGAVVDLSEFPDYPDVAQRFSPGAMIPLSFGGGVYGLPETQTFPMLFYRKDILHELKLKLPDTWDDVIVMLPYLQKKQLNFGLPTVTGMVSGVTMPIYSMLLLQRGGTLYTEGGKHSNIQTLESIEALTLYTRFYTDYQIPQTIDFINRFRSGAMPIGIADYSMYNQLSVFAPELDGIWGFAPVPGTEREDGTIDRTVSSTIAACILLDKSDKKEQAWEFMKWWTSAQTQKEFGLELESILGTAARYATANLEALEQIPWTSASAAELKKQWAYATGLPEVPGGYYTPRYIDFAFRDVVNNSLDPGDLLVKYAKVIDTEIEMKRKEFKLED